MIATLTVTKQQLPLSQALRKLRTERARIRLLEIMHSRGLSEASHMLLEKLSKSTDHTDLSKAADVALGMGLNGTARNLLIKAAQKASTEGVANTFQYLRKLKGLDQSAAAILFMSFCRKGTSKMDALTRYRVLAHYARIWGDLKLARSYRKLAVAQVLESTYVTPRDLVRAIEMMKSLGQRNKAQILAREYVEEVLGDSRGRLQFDWHRMSYFEQLGERYQNVLQIFVEAGIGKQTLTALTEAAKEKLRGKTRLGLLAIDLQAISHLAKIAGERQPRRLYRAAAKKCENRSPYLARRYYATAGCLDKKTRERLATREIQQLTSRLANSTPNGYLDFWNTTEVLTSSHRATTGSSSVSPRVAYYLGLETDMMRILDRSKEMHNDKLRERLLTSAVSRLKKCKLYPGAAAIAEELRGPEAAKSLWALSSLQSEDEAVGEAGNEARTLAAAATFAKRAGDLDRHDRLLAQCLEKLRSNETEDLSLYESVSRDIKTGFFKSHKSLCLHVIDRMKQNGQHIVLAKFLLRLGIDDREVLEKALLMLEEAGEFSEAAKMATALGDETLARTYSFMQNYEP